MLFWGNLGFIMPAHMGGRPCKKADTESKKFGWWLALAVLLSGAHCSRQGKTTDYCQWEVFNASCGAGHVILMETALYGRMTLGRCVESEYYIGCQDDVLILSDGRCSGRHSCTIPIPNEEMHKRVPCPKDLMTYLQASYTCQPVSLPKTESDICATGYELEQNGPSGLLASVITEAQGFGGAKCPWTIRVLPGQKINLTLIDFTLAARTTSKPGDAQYCQVYATVRERGAKRDTTVCGGTQRERVVYVSQSNEVDVSLVRTSTPDDQGYFLVKYEAIGCPDLAPPSGAYVRRTGDQLVVSCNHTSHTWHLVCQGTEWVGDIRNCTDEIWPPGSPGSSINLLPPYGLLAAILIGVVLGICIGSALLGVVLCCFRKRTVVTGQRRPPVQEPTEMKEHHSPRAFGGPEYGYTHVWEMRSHPTLPQGEPNVHKLSSDDKTLTMTKSASYPRNLKSDHVYESPKFEKRHTDTLPGPVYHEFDSDAETRQNARNKKAATTADITAASDESDDETMVKVQSRMSSKPRGYRPVPVEAASPKPVEKVHGHNT